MNSRPFTLEKKKKSVGGVHSETVSRLSSILSGLAVVPNQSVGRRRKIQWDTKHARNVDLPKDLVNPMNADQICEAELFTLASK